MLYKTEVGIHRRKYVEMNTKMKRKLAEETQNAITESRSTSKARRYRIEMYPITEFCVLWLQMNLILFFLTEHFFIIYQRLIFTQISINGVPTTCQTQNKEFSIIVSLTHCSHMNSVGFLSPLNKSWNESREKLR